MSCPACSADSLQGSRFCASCGHPLSPNSESPKPSPPPRVTMLSTPTFDLQGAGVVRENSKGRMLFIAGAVTLVPLAVVLASGMSSRDSRPADAKQGPSTTVVAQAADTKSNSEQALERPKTATELRKEAAEKAKVDESLRKVYAKTTENMLLGENYNVDVNAVGPKATTLRLKWVFVSKVTAYQFANGDPKMFSAMRQMGFKHFVITDGYEETWTWTL